MRSCQWFAIICVLVLPGKLQCCHPTAPGTASEASNAASATGSSDTSSTSSAPGISEATTAAAAATTAAAAATTTTTTAAAAAAAATASCTSCNPATLPTFVATDIITVTRGEFRSAIGTVTPNGVVTTDANGCSTLPLTCPDPTTQVVIIRILIVNGLPGGDFDTEVVNSGVYTLVCNSAGVWTAPANVFAAANAGRQVDAYACIISPPGGG